MVAGCRHEGNRSAPLLFRNLGKVIEQRHHDRLAGGIVERRVVVAVLMGDDDDVFIGPSRQRAPHVGTRQALALFDRQPHLQFHRLARTNQIANDVAVLVTHVEAGNRDWSARCDTGIAGVPERLPDCEVVGDAIDHPNGGRAVLMVKR